MVKTSLRVIIVLLIISLGVGIGLGRVTKSDGKGSLKKEITQKAEEILTLTTEINDLKTTAAALTSDLQEKQADYESLLAEQTRLSDEFQVLQENYETLLADIDQATLDNLRSLRDQVTSLSAEKNQLNSLLAQLQIENTTLKASLDSITQLNATLTERIGKAESERDRLNIELTQLKQKLTPSPDNAIPPRNVWGNPDFRSTEWSGRDYDLQKKVEEIGELYASTHLYIEGETDCNDMAVDIWNMLLKEEIKSVIVVGNLEKEGEAFTELQHAWIDIFDAQGRVIYLEPLTGEVLYGRLPDGSVNTKVIPYREGYIYEKPSDLWKDLKPKLW